MPEPVLLLGVGPFGTAVARHLVRLRRDVRRGCAEDVLLSRKPSSRMIVLAAWRPVVKQCAELDIASRIRGCPFVPLVMEGPTMSIGPVVLPGRHGCWHCWIKRRDQHEQFASARSAVNAFYDRCVDAGPSGYLDAVSLLAASRLSSAIDNVDRDTQEGGELWQMNILTREVIVGQVIGVDACPHCGLKRPLQDRTCRALKTHFSAVPRLLP